MLQLAGEKGRQIQRMADILQDSMRRDSSILIGEVIILALIQGV